MNTTTHAPGSPEAFLAGCQPYKFKEGDYNLIAAARECLVKHSNNNPVLLAAFDSDPNVVQALELTTNIQLYKLNLFLNSQYSQLSGDISTHRGFIIQDYNLETWLKMFDTYHAPTMVRLGLPRVYA